MPPYKLPLGLMLMTLSVVTLVVPVPEQALSCRSSPSSSAPSLSALVGAWTTPRGRPISHCPGCGKWLGSAFAAADKVDGLRRPSVRHELARGLSSLVDQRRRLACKFRIVSIE